MKRERERERDRGNTTSKERTTGKRRLARDVSPLCSGESADLPDDPSHSSSPDVGSPRTLVRQHICRPNLRTRSNRMIDDPRHPSGRGDRQLVSRKALPVYCGFGHASLVLTTATTSRPHLRRPTYIDHTSVPSSPSSS